MSFCLITNFYHHVFDLPADEFHLSYAGRTLDPDETLQDYDVDDGEQLLLISESTAGVH